MSPVEKLAASEDTYEDLIFMPGKDKFLDISHFKQKKLKNILN
ncbi:hypothetical protein [Pantoea piersonii]|nr:hypothetical protein [Pantoea piersonii]